MGFLSNLYGGRKEDKALRKVMAHISRILDDERFQTRSLGGGEDASDDPCSTDQPSGCTCASR